MTLLTRSPILQRIVLKTSAELAAPTAAMIADYSALYVLSTPPYTRYVSNGTTLVGASTVDTLATLVAQVASLSSSVNSRASDAQLRDRSTHTGNDPASKSLMDDGTTVQAAVTALRQAAVPANASDPAVTTTPTIAGTKTVGSTLTITPGTVTDGAGGAHSNLYVWYRVNASNLAAPIPGVSALTYILSAADLGFYVYATQQALDTVTGRLSVAVSTTLTAVITGTAPTNSVAPTLSPSGTQAAGVVITCSTGTWANAATYGYLFYDNGVPIGQRSSTSTTTLTSAQAGHAITADVLAISSLNVPAAAAVAASNTVTVAGTNTVANTVRPVLVLSNGEAAGQVFQGFLYVITPGTWTLNGSTTTPTSKQWDFYINGVYFASNTVATAYISLGNFPVGAVLKVVETVIIGGQSYSSSLSAATSYTTAAAPATLTVQVNTSTATFTSGTSISPYIPVTATGGTAPYTYSVNPALPGTLALNTSTGQITGTANTIGSTAYTISIVDSAAATVTGQTTIVIQAASSITIKNRINGASSPTTQQRAYITSNGLFLYTDTEVTYPMTGASSLGGSNVRFGLETINGKGYIRQAVDSSVDTQYNGYWRTDIAWYDNQMPVGTVYWMAGKWIIPASVWNRVTAHSNIGVDGNFAVIWDTHSNINSNLQMSLRSWEASDRKMMLQVANTGREYNVSSFITGDVEFTMVIKERIDAGQGGGYIDCWMNGTHIGSGLHTDTGQNKDTGDSSFYPKCACYTGGTTGTYWWWLRDFIHVIDNSEQYTEPQIRALLLT